MIGPFQVHNLVPKRASVPSPIGALQRTRIFCLAGFLFCWVRIGPGIAAAATSVLTHHNDNARTGANLTETQLITSNVNTNQFGLLYTRTVDDQIYAQPLIMTNVNIAGQEFHNLVIVATVNDSVYAFDADNASVTAPYWIRSFLNPPYIVAPASTDMSAIGACGGGYRDFSGNIGIVGTPVIDPTSGTIYLVARTKEYGTNFVQKLHALDIATGAERPNSPVIITATYPGTGDGSVGGIIPFDSQRQNQRPGLALVNGVVYLSWASHCDNGPYHGWVIGYDVSTLAQAAVFNDTPNGYNGGIWMSGQAPAADDSGNLYLVTGNGLVDRSGTVNRGESFLKLTPNGTRLNVASWFTPYNWQNLENGDIDLGSGGLLLIPGTTLAFSGGKEGVMYLVNRDNMGGLTSSSTRDDNIVQSFRVTSDEVHGGPVWWQGPANAYCYLWPSSVFLQQYIFNRASGTFSLPPYAQSPTAAPRGQPGGILSLSANGTNAGSAIVWAFHQLTGDANQSVRPGILHAYDALNVSAELWNSEQLRARDSVGNFAKFVPPTVANGKVYLATFSNRLNVYGLFVINEAPSILQQPQSATRQRGDAVSFTVTARGTPPLAYQWSFNSNYIAGATSSSYSLTNVQASDSGYYSVLITNLFGSVTSSNALLTVMAAPAILTQPQSQSLLVGQNATFIVVAAGSQPLDFQWRFNGNAVPGATSSIYTLQSVQPANQGAYSVIVSNTFGFTTSSNATLSVVLLGAWGDNTWGQTSLLPVQTNLVAIAAGAWHNLGLLANGTVAAWGNNANGQCNVPSKLANVVAVSAGGYHSLALKWDKTVAAWGANYYHQALPPANLSNVIAIAAGAWHSLALRVDGTVLGWGDNSFGQTAIPPYLTNVIAVAAGGNHSLALQKGGTVFAWGQQTDANGNYAGQSAVPPGLAGVVAIGAGEYHSLAVRSDGTVVAWGDNSQNQASPPIDLAGAVSVAGGGSHSLALKADGTVRAWGNNWNGQCDVPALALSVASIAAGESHTLLLAGNTQAPPYSEHPTRNDSVFSIVLQTYAGKTYALEYKDSLAATSWILLPSIPGNGAKQFLIDSTATSVHRYYRVREW